jgi:ribonuclease VapC
MEGGPPCVLDASAVLALLNGEPGGERVKPLLGSAAMSALNWCEVLQRYEGEYLDSTSRREQFESLGIELRSFDVRQAELTAGLLVRTRKAGLGIADRACLALALEVGGKAVTADRSWVGLDLGVEIDLIR